MRCEQIADLVPVCLIEKDKELTLGENTVDWSDYRILGENILDGIIGIGWEYISCKTDVGGTRLVEITD